MVGCFLISQILGTQEGPLALHSLENGWGREMANLSQYLKMETDYQQEQT